jgi:hypothetical protein
LILLDLAWSITWLDLTRLEGPAPLAWILPLLRFVQLKSWTWRLTLGVWRLTLDAISKYRLTSNHHTRCSHSSHLHLRSSPNPSSLAFSWFLILLHPHSIDPTNHIDCQLPIAPSNLEEKCMLPK